jgi:hypothetical protein
MRWNVEGADGRTGEEHVYPIDPDTAEDAEQKARDHGVLVSAVHRALVQSTNDQLDELAAASMSRTARVGPAPVPAPSVESPPIAYRSPDTPGAQVPAYLGLRIGSSVLMIFAVLYYISAAVALTIGIYVAGQQGVFVAATFLLWALVAAMIGGLLQALSAACIALRDIARNSFRP